MDTMSKLAKLFVGGMILLVTLKRTITFLAQSLSGSAEP